MQGIHVADHLNQKIRRINSESFTSTIAGTGALGNQNGAGATASFNYPYALCFDNTTGDLFVSDNGVVRRITLAGVVSNFATIGGFQAGIVVDNSSNIYVANVQLQRGTYMHFMLYHRMDIKSTYSHSVLTKGVFLHYLT